MKVLAISGSIRKGSLNTSLLRAAAQLLPDGSSMEIRTLEGIELLDPNTLEAGFPDLINQLAADVKQADALVLASPEFNYSVTGAMKNVIDWLSIHPEKPLKKKPTALMSASPSGLGGARAQYQLRQMLIFPDVKVLAVPEVMVGNAFERFTSDGELTDQNSKDLIKLQMQALKDLCN